MPLLDGYQTTRRIRQQPRWQGLLIIALTANALPENKRCQAAGMDDYLAPAATCAGPGRPARAVVAQDRRLQTEPGASSASAPTGLQLLAESQAPGLHGRCIQALLAKQLLA